MESGNSSSQSSPSVSPSTRPSPSYSLTLRIEYPNAPGMLGRVTSVIGEAGGDIGAIDIITTARGTITRDITFSTANHEHGQKIIDAVRQLSKIDVVNVSDRTFLIHLGGKLEITGKVPMKTRDDLSMAYTPGVARISDNIVHDPDDVFNLTIKKNTVAIVSDGSEVLGLGAAGPLASLPVLEGKALLFKEFAGVDAFPLPLKVDNIDDMVTAVRAVSPVFGAIHLEDLASPRCFEIERRMSEALDIPVMHNDQHGTAIVVLAGLLNAVKITRKNLTSLKIVINSSGAAGLATTHLLLKLGVRDIIVCGHGRAFAPDYEYSSDEPGTEIARAIVAQTNPRGVTGMLPEALQGADAFIGFGGRSMLTKEDIRSMNHDAIVFAMANPEPEISPDSIQDIARVVATGRSDYPNQINNMLCFPGFFRGLLDARAKSINDEMKIAAAEAIANTIGRDELHEEHLIPSIFDRRVSKNVSAAVSQKAHETGVARRPSRKTAGF
jgi:malate dehydrogenase (oxaloacetate-decarboxylating)